MGKPITFRKKTFSWVRTVFVLFAVEEVTLFSIVIGTLSAPDYGLFVSHNHPDGRALFNVYSAPRVGLPWGTFSLDKDTKNKDHRHGPSYDEPVSGTPHSAFKVSNIISSAASAETEWRTVLVARLRFKPDVAEPTSL